MSPSSRRNRSRTNARGGTLLPVEPAGAVSTARSAEAEAVSGHDAVDRLEQPSEPRYLVEPAERREKGSEPKRPNDRRGSAGDRSVGFDELDRGLAAGLGEPMPCEHPRVAEGFEPDAARHEARQSLHLCHAEWTMPVVDERRAIVGHV